MLSAEIQIRDPLNSKRYFSENGDASQILVQILASRHCLIKFDVIMHLDSLDV